MAKQSVTMKKCDNDLFYLCSLIEYIARKTYNTKKYVINKIEKKVRKNLFACRSIPLWKHNIMDYPQNR